MKKTLSAFFTLSLLMLSTLPSQAKRGDSDRYKQTADYVVPVEDILLEPYSHYSFEIKWIKTTPGSRSFKYDLPKELVGTHQDVKLKEVSPGIFEANNATAECVDTPQLKCTIKYKNLVNDMGLAEARIANTYKDSQEIQARLEIMRRFASDSEPIGILSVVE